MVHGTTHVGLPAFLAAAEREVIERQLRKRLLNLMDYVSYMDEEIEDLECDLERLLNGACPLRHEA